jgi:quinol monooxygenase YgiN
MKLIASLSAFLAMALLSVSAPAAPAADAPLRHVVHFKFKPQADQTQVQKVVDEFAALRGKIPGIEALEYGTNVSPEGLDQGYTHCWILTFKNAADRDAYLVHPDHKTFVDLVKPLLEGALVVDFFAKQAAEK